MTDIDKIPDAAAAQLAASDKAAASAAGSGAAGASGGTAADKATDVQKLLDKMGLQVQQGADGPVLVRPITVNKQQRLVTLDELATSFTKAEGADEKFRQADQMRKDAQARQAEYEQSLNVLNDLRAMKDESKTVQERVAAMQRVAVALGEDPAVVAEQAKEMLAQGTAAANGAGAKQQETRPLRLEDLPPEVQEAVRAKAENDRTVLREKIYAAVDKSVEDDPVLRTLEKDALAEVKALARQDVRARVVIDGQEPTTDLFVDVLQTLRQRVRKFRSGGGTDASGSAGVGTTNLGGLGGGTGLQGTGTGVNLDEPLSILDPNYTEKMRARIATRVRQGQQQ